MSTPSPASVLADLEAFAQWLKEEEQRSERDATAFQYDTDKLTMSARAGAFRAIADKLSVELRPRLQALFAQQETEKAEKVAWIDAFHKKARELNAALEAADARATQLQQALEASNAVCSCGCPESEHENYGEDGQACENEDHQCVPTNRAVITMLNDLRARATHAEAQLEEYHQKNNALLHAHDDLMAVFTEVEAKRDALRTQLLAYTQPHA